MKKTPSYEQLLNKLDSPLNFQSLSGQKSLTALRRNGKLHINPPSRNQRIFQVSKQVYELVLKRYQSLPSTKQLERKSYLKADWPESPGATVASSVAALIALEATRPARDAITEIIAASPDVPVKVQHAVLRSHKP